MHLAGRQLPPLPPALDIEAIRQLLRQIGEGILEDRLFAAHQFAHLIEREEAKYRALVGDPHFNPNLRSHYTIGKVLNAIKDQEELYDTIVDSWISSRGATLEQQVAGLRLLLACLDCWLFQYPLTEEALVEKLGHWAVAGLDKAPVLGDEPPTTSQELLEEAKQTYSLGLLGIALANEEYADEAVQTPLVSACCAYLQQAVLGSNSSSGGSVGGNISSSNQTATTRSTGNSKAASAATPGQQQDGQQLPALLVAAAQDPEGFEDEIQQLRLKRLIGVVRCLTCTGEYVEALAPFLSHQGVECCCTLLQAWHSNGVLLNDNLQLICSLLAHRRFGELLVEQKGVQLLLAAPRTSHTHMGLSLALFGLASLPLAFERTCALSAPIPAELMSAGLALLTASSDAARKNAALFTDAAVRYPVLLECFDSADGLCKLLYPLRQVVLLLQAGGPAELRAVRQVAYHASRALLQYVRAHLVLHMASLQRRLRDSQAPLALPQPHKPLNTTAAVMDELIAALHTDAKLAEVFVRTRWPLLEQLSEQNLVGLLLDLIRALPGEERYYSDICLYSLEVLQLITLSPLPRRSIIASSSSSSSTTPPHGSNPQQRTGMGILLHAASTGNATPFYGLADPEVIATALHVICNCVTAPPSLAYLLPAPGSNSGTSAAAAAASVVVDKPIEAHQTPQRAELPTPAELTGPPALELGPSAVSSHGRPSLGDALEAGYAAARQTVRASNGIRVLLMLLQSRQHLAPAAADRVRALACTAILGLARDSSIRHILTKLQVGKLLAELVGEPVAPSAAGAGSSRRDMNAGADEAAQGAATGAVWQERFHRAALELIAIATSSTSGGAGRHEHRLSAAAATDAAAPALLKIERAAIAASTPITYQPPELLLLIYEHLKASGLHGAAASLAKEAGLASSKGQQQQQQAVPLHAATPQQQQAGGSVQVVQSSAAPPAVTAAAAGDEHTTPAGCFKQGLSPSVAGSDPAAATTVSCKDRRRTLSLAPGLLQHWHKEPCDTAPPQQQPQQQQQQQQKPIQQQQQQQQQQQPPEDQEACLRVSQRSPAGDLLSTSTCREGKNRVANKKMLSGSKRRTTAAAELRTGQEAAGQGSSHGDMANGTEAPASKRQAVGDSAAATTAPADGEPAAAEAGSRGSSSNTEQEHAFNGFAALPAAAKLQAQPVSMQPQPSSAPAHLSGKKGIRTAAKQAAAAGSDAAYVQSFSQQQQGRQQQPGQAKPTSNARTQTPTAQQASRPHATGFAGFHSSSATPAAAAAAAAGAMPAPVSPVSPMVAGSSAAAASPGGGLCIQQQQPAGATAAAVAPGVNPLLTNLPARQWGKTGGGFSRRLSGGVDVPQKMTPIAEAVPEPKPLPLHVQVAARDVMTGPPANSRLSSIVMAYLRQQHRAACLASPQPVSVVPPVSLLKSYALPVATRPQQAPANVAVRRSRQEIWGGFGGRGGAAATRRLVWSRFRLTQTLRDDGPLLTACSFLRGFELLVAGTSNGELRLHDAYSGETVELVDAHTAPVNLLQASNWLGGSPGDQLLLSSSRSEVLLWRADGFDTGPMHSWPGLRGGRFNPTATQLVGISVGASPRQARVYDTTTGSVVAILDEAAAAAAAAANAAGGSGAAGAGAAGSGGNGGAGAGGELVRGATAASFSPSGELVLWGATLWDPRVPAPLHTFDQLSAGGAGGCFHPGGAEIILNSEVWDLRTRKLLRSMPLLDGTSIAFNSGGDVLCAWLRRPADDSMAALLQLKRRRHALATSFCSVDARSYSEIATVQVERAVLDLCLDPNDSYLAAVAVDVGGGLEGTVTSSVRLYEVGRQRPAADEDDDDDGTGEESDEEDEEGEDIAQALLANDDTEEVGDVGGAAGRSDGDEVGTDDAADHDADEFELEEGMTLEDAIADMYEEAMAAGVDPAELEISVDSEDLDHDAEDMNDDRDDASLLSALQGTSSSEYETDEEA